MNHEEALKAAMAGGPLPVEARAHMSSCPTCAAELAALKSTEAALGAARPAAEGDPAWESRLIREISFARGFRRASRSTSARWLRIAASLLLAAALLTAWRGLRPDTNGQIVAGAAGVATSAQTRPALPDQTAPLWTDMGEDSTASLLQATESFTQKIQKEQGVEGAEGLDVLESGGWNG